MWLLLLLSWSLLWYTSSMLFWHIVGNLYHPRTFVCCFVFNRRYFNLACTYRYEPVMKSLSYDIESWIGLFGEYVWRESGFCTIICALYVNRIFPSFPLFFSLFWLWLPIEFSAIQIAIYSYLILLFTICAVGFIVYGCGLLRRLSKFPIHSAKWRGAVRKVSISEEVVENSFGFTFDELCVSGAFLFLLFVLLPFLSVGGFSHNDMYGLFHCACHTCDYWVGCEVHAFDLEHQLRTLIELFYFFRCSYFSVLFCSVLSFCEGRDHMLFPSCFLSVLFRYSFTFAFSKFSHYHL